MYDEDCGPRCDVQGNSRVGCEEFLCTNGLCKLSDMDYGSPVHRIPKQSPGDYADSVPKATPKQRYGQHCKDGADCQAGLSCLKKRCVKIKRPPIVGPWVPGT